MVLGEHQDMSAEARNRTSLDLPGSQQQLLEAVHATGKPIRLYVTDVCDQWGYSEFLSASMSN